MEIPDKFPAVVQNSQPLRVPVDYLYTELNWDFLHMMARIAYYAGPKYKRADQYTDGELTGDRAPVNHIAEHFRFYLKGEKHDHFEDPGFHLAAIAYNAMMEYYYYTQRGIRRSGVTLPMGAMGNGLR